MAFDAPGPRDVSIVRRLLASIPNEIVEREPVESLPPTANMVVKLEAIAPKERAAIGVKTCCLLQTKAMHEDEPGAE